MKKLIIAIDPDLRKCGYVVYDQATTFEMIVSSPLWDVFGMVRQLIFVCGYENILVLIEDPRLKRGTWHKGGKGAARNVGKCEAVAVILEDFCKEHKINYRMIAPAGYSKLFDNEDVFRRTTGWEGRTNKDARAAAAMAWTWKDEKF